MCRSYARETLRLRLDHCAKIVAAVRSLLLQVGADCSQVFVVDCFLQHCSVDVAAFLVGRPHVALRGVQ